MISSPIPGFRLPPPVFHIVDLLRVWLLAFGLSVLAGILPAWKASRLSPLIALRRE